MTLKVYNSSIIYKYIIHPIFKKGKETKQSWLSRALKGNYLPLVGNNLYNTFHTVHTVIFYNVFINLIFSHSLY